MKEILSAFLRGAGLYHPLRDLRADLRYARYSKRAREQWEQNARPLPPPDCIKHDAIRQCAENYGLSVMVETGTWKGDTIFALRKVFREIHTIELDPILHQFAVKRFAHLKHINCHLGDSAAELPKVIGRLTEPALFWLDGHYCGGPSARASIDTPISSEIKSVLARRNPKDVVLIDDARLFVGIDGYPTIDEIKRTVMWHAVDCSVMDDIIRITPR